MDLIYPDFYKTYMISTEGISNIELERRFLEAEWLTEQHMDEIIDNIPTKEEMEADNVHHSTTKCKSSFEEKCVRQLNVDLQITGDCNNISIFF